MHEQRSAVAQLVEGVSEFVSECLGTPTAKVIWRLSRVSSYRLKEPGIELETLVYQRHCVLSMNKTLFPLLSTFST